MFALLSASSIHEANGFASSLRKPRGALNRHVLSASASASSSYTALSSVELLRTTDGSLAVPTEAWDDEVAVVVLFRSYG